MSEGGDLLQGFGTRRVTVDGIGLHCRIGGPENGSPLLLLHGYPQTHLCWHKVAPALAGQGFRVVLPDLRGYGDSDKPAAGPGSAAYAKRAMAADMVGLMGALGHDRFDLAGHDRGARVAHRLALDHPAALRRLALLDIAPTLTMFQAADAAFATAYEHWFFLIQPAPFPETMIAAAPEYYLRSKLAAWSRVPDAFDPRAVAEYLRCFRQPDTLAATCADYRAAAGVDLDHDRADAHRRIEASLLVLWGGPGFVGQSFDVPATWRAKAAGPIEGEAFDCGHFLPEEAPAATLAALAGFFRR